MPTFYFCLAPSIYALYFQKCVYNMGGVYFVAFCNNNSLPENSHLFLEFANRQILSKVNFIFATITYIPHLEFAFMQNSPLAFMRILN